MESPTASLAWLRLASICPPDTDAPYRHKGQLHSVKSIKSKIKCLKSTRNLAKLSGLWLDESRPESEVESWPFYEDVRSGHSLSHSDHQSECCLSLAVQTIISKSKRTEIAAGLEMKVQSIQLDKGENIWFRVSKYYLPNTEMIIPEKSSEYFTMTLKFSQMDF